MVCNLFHRLPLPASVFGLVLAMLVFVLAVAPDVNAQSFSGRGVDMRALDGQAAQCRRPALQLQQRVIVLRQGIRDILECNASGGLFQRDRTCVPAVSPAHTFESDRGSRNEDALSFDDPADWALIGGPDGEDVVCCQDTVEENESACPPNQTGRIVDYYSVNCATGERTFVRTADSCMDECQKDSQIRTVDCPKGEDGSITEQRDFSCSSETEGSWGDWYETNNTCVSDECVPDSNFRDSPCPEGQVGTIREQQDFTCDAATGEGSWGDWYEIDSNCSEACEEDTESGQDNCPGDQVGFVQTARQFICISETEGEWRDLPDEEFCCTPDSDFRDSPCPEGQVGTIREQQDFTCGAATGEGSWGDWYEIDRNCSDDCEPETRTQTVACPAGLIGEITEEQDYICPEAGDPYWTKWIEVSRDCCESERTNSCPAGQIGTGIVEQRSSCGGAWTEVSRDCATKLTWQLTVAASCGCSDSCVSTCTFNLGDKTCSTKGATCIIAQPMNECPGTSSCTGGANEGDDIGIGGGGQGGAGGDNGGDPGGNTSSACNEMTFTCQ